MGTDAEIESLVLAFEAGTLPRAEWTHHAHLIVALWYLRRHEREQATRRIREGIQAYNALGGKPMGYHETITLAWVAVVSQFLAENDRGQSLSALAGGLAVMLACALTLGVGAVVGLAWVRNIGVYPQISLGIAGGALLIGFVGLMDDRYRLRGRQKLIGQMAAAFLAICSPSYFNSFWCRDERKLFLTHHNAEESLDSILVFVATGVRRLLRTEDEHSLARRQRPAGRMHDRRSAEAGFQSR